MSAGKRINLIGQTFNGWRVIADAGKDAAGRSIWHCVCIGCDQNKTVNGYNLTSGRSRRCRRCSAAQVAVAFIKHNESRTVMYQRWTAMRHRCGNPQNAGWADYGGRGIKVCAEWDKSYEAFRDYILTHLGEPPTPRHTIDRIRNDGHYEPGNIRWATQSEQALNRRPRKKKGFRIVDSHN